jgi:hypothetical protein
MQILADSLQISRETISKFLNGVPVDKGNFIEISKALGFPDWTEIAETQADLEAELPLKTHDDSIVHQVRGWTAHYRCLRIFGRDSFVERILGYLADPQEACILALCGDSGFGKTECATRVAELALETNLFANVLWVTARQTELVGDQISQIKRTNSLSWQQFINQIAHQLDCSVENVQPRLRKNAFLIVLDNAETAATDDILAGFNKMLNPSRVLITSRRKSNCQYVKLISVEGLDRESSDALLQYEAKYKNVEALSQASEPQLQRIYELSRGAPLALHFIAGRATDDRQLEPVLLALEEASGDVEAFYTFALRTAWERISEDARRILIRMAEADAGLLWEQILDSSETINEKLSQARRTLERWYLIESVKDSVGNWRYDLHPWMRRSLRSEWAVKWRRDFKDLKREAQDKYDLDT